MGGFPASGTGTITHRYNSATGKIEPIPSNEEIEAAMKRLGSGGSSGGITPGGMLVIDDLDTQFIAPFTVE